jgi:sec-independent protein translocase protein TatA
MGWPELVLILVVLLVIFGAGRLPEVGNAIGRGMKELRRAADDRDEPAVGVDTTDATKPERGARGTGA